ncbi:MAG: hypothetical protein QGH60_18485 [Phycisphaerae bacterium]|jgi:predicted small secreted protein|nr:hypothetical protein [Phycisphaerae bacterium]
MKTNVLFITLLTAAVAFVTGCETTPGSGRKISGWQSKIDGSYKSVIFNGETDYPAKTTFKTKDGKISGTFEMDNFGLTITGKLVKFRVVGDRKLKCRWINDEDRAGNFNLTFSEDLSSFKGHWDPDDGDGKGAWNGKK